MKCVFLFLLCCLLFGMNSNLFAVERETVNGIKWSYQISNGEAQIYNYNSSVIPTSTSGAITIPFTLGGYPVTSIGSYAFEWCERLTSVTFEGVPPSVGENAFDGSYPTGYYLPEHAAAWEAVLDANGEWHGLKMKQRRY